MTKVLEWIRRGDCIVVTSHKPRRNGYIPITIKGRDSSLHRIVCERKHGLRPSKDAMHSCDNRACINPNHLSFGSRLQNMKGAVDRNRMPREKKHHGCKLTDEEVVAIRLSSESTRVLGRAYGVAQQTISDIKRRKRRVHVK